MSARRIWLDWSHPCLPSAADWLIAHAGHAGLAAGQPDQVDLGDVLCVLPGRRAARGLLAEIVRRCRERGRSLVPPQVMTPGPLADRVLGVSAAVATAAERRLAWLAALRTMVTDDDGCRACKDLLPVVPHPDDLVGLAALATRLAAITDELSGDLVGPDAMAEHADDLLMHAEADRWRALARVETRARSALSDAGLEDPGPARIAALEPGTPAADPVDPGDMVVLVGITDLNAVQRRAIEELGERAVALIAAPESEADRFDHLGCVRTESWTDGPRAPLQLDDDQIIVADRPFDQAQALLHALAGLDGRYGPDAITVGLGDEGLAEMIIRAGRWAGVTFHRASGTPMPSTATVRLLAAVADHLADTTAATAAALARHPDLEQTDIARALDPLAGLPRPLAGWCEPILATLERVYARTDHAATIDTCTELRDLVASLVRTADTLQPTVDAATAIRLVLAEAAPLSVAETPRADAIEMLGWLELALDPAPALVATGVNDGFVPGAVTSDAFLPDSLRARAGLMCNARRYARDAWAMQTMLHGRREMRVITGRRTASGDPLPPSRLLLACTGRELARRVRRLSDESAAFQADGWIGAPPPAERSRFTIPSPPPGPVDLPRLPVTAFRAYLECPYRFWLRYIERLRAVEDEPDELDALAFGTLTHETLRDFGSNRALRDSTDAEQIAAFLVTALRRRTSRGRGSGLPPAVRIQLARLEERLRVFAAAQAAHRRAGWRIVATEHELPAGTRLTISGADPLRVTGSVDRIDRHDDEDAWLVIDYKTSEKAKTPDEAHRRAGTWKDLQLPLYGHLLPLPGARLAYFNLPRELDRTGLAVADWSAGELDEAVSEARRVVTAIRAGVFDASDDFGWAGDEFRFICQTAVYGAAQTQEAGA